MSKYFKISEFTKSATASAKGIKNQPSVIEVENLNRLMQMLDKVRERLGKPIIVTSGYRCAKLNAAVGGSKTSQHLKGEAADIKPSGCSVKSLFELCKKMVANGEIEVGQLIDEKCYSWVHISIPDGRHHNQILHL